MPKPRTFARAALAVLAAAACLITRTDCSRRAGPPPMNIVIVCVNCLRKDGIGLYAGHGCTPHIDAFAEQGGIVFENLVCPATWSDPCLYELFTARDFRKDPDRAGKAFHEDVVIEDMTRRLPECLLSPRATPGLGAGGYHRLWVYNRRLKRVPALAKVERLKPPFFLFVHASTLHIPYAATNFTADPAQVRLEDAPPEVRRHYADALRTVNQARQLRDKTVLSRIPFLVAAFGADLWEGTPLGQESRTVYGWMVNRRVLATWRRSETYAADIDLLRRLYQANVRTVDAEFALLLESLEKRGLLDSTIVVVMGDHGEHLGQHGCMEHWEPYDEIINPPLIIRVPGRSGKVVIRDQVRTRDVLPTILDLAGVTLSEGATRGMDGRSLTSLLDGRGGGVTAFARGQKPIHAIRRDDGWKMIWHLDTGRKEVYDLRSDPGETKNLVGARPHIQGHLRAELFRHAFGHE